jgi:hypothetical protein
MPGQCGRTAYRPAQIGGKAEVNHPIAPLRVFLVSLGLHLARQW